MCATIALRDIVGEGQYHFVVAVVPPHRDFDTNVVTLARHIDRLFHQWGLRPVEVFDEFLDATFVEQVSLKRLSRAQILQDDTNARIQKCQLAQALFEDVEFIIPIAKGIGRGKESHLGALAPIGVTFDAQVFFGKATFKPGVMLFAVAPDAQLKIVGQGVYNRYAHPMQSARNLIRVAVKLTASVQLGHDDLSSRNTLFFVDTNRNAAPVVADRHGPISVDIHINMVGMTGQSLIDTVVHDLVNHVMQTRAVVGITDIHARTLAHSL